MKTISALGVLSLLLGVVRGASFYGDGYVHLKVEESSNRNSLYVRFRTASQSGVLFLASGHNDYLLLELNSGHLQVKLDLGSGDHILHSDRGTQLNDLAWHSIEFLQVRDNITLIVDKHTQTSHKIPGPHYELNIRDGIYVGSTGGLDKAFLANDLTGFRGCLDEVLFNEHNLLSSLRPYSGLKNVYEVSLGCSPQFFASEEDPISFFSSKAYVSLPHWTAEQEWVFECSVHTAAQEGIIIYNSARLGDFVALEIKEGLLVAVMGRGGTKTELRSLTFINDRKWHFVSLRFTSKSLQLTVDEETVKTRVSARSKTLQLKGFLFLGGIDDSTRSEVRKIGLASVAGKRVKGGSFKGCMRDIKISEVKMGLPNAVVTKDISVGCEPEKEPEMVTTVAPTTISVTQVSSIDTSTLARGLIKKYGHNFLVLRNLVVPEGGRASLESKHIKVNLDFKKLGIRQSQIMFRIEEQPVHGQLRLDIDPEQEEYTFSMLDLWHGRVMYIHGGSEDPQDFFMFTVFSSSRREVPDYLKAKRLHRFNITVTPTNDAPELSLPEGNLFVLLENTRKRLTTDVLKATDIDSNHTDFVYSVLGNLNADAGFLELEDNPDHAVTSFSHSALAEGKINYVHTGVRNSRIVLRVSDGEKVSNTVVLRIMALPLEYSIANNTGVEVTQGEMVLIGTKQLAVQTNGVRQVVDIRYDVVEPPRFGELQRLHSSGEWKLTSSFSQRLLEKERLRYFSSYQGIQSSNVTDQFKCKVTVAARATEELIFPITVKWINYSVEKNHIIELDKVRRVTIDSDYLYATAEGVSLSEDEIYFRVVLPPKRGFLLLNNQKLSENSTFSQRDLTDLKVEYQLVDRPYEDTNDKFKFQVFSKHAHSAGYVFRFKIKADVTSIFMKNQGLNVLEGERKIITKDELFAETLSTKELYYTVIRSPKHGKLSRINRSNSTNDNNNIMTFSNQDILDERIMYVHDDSETTHDEFTFIASTSPGVKASVTEDEVNSKEGTFNISVQLVNDEKPIRVVDKVFHVVRDGQRLLTLDDLCYHDADSDFNDGQLVYTRRGIPMGDLVLVNDTSQKLYQFRQEDLEQKRVLFVHRGVSSGRFVLFVSDGKHYVSTLLDISAQDPYLKIGNNTGLLVQKGQAKPFSNANFSVLTNLDIRDDSEIMFKVTQPPKHGGLYWNEDKAESFTLRELKAGALSYRHDDSKNLADSYSVKVKAKNLQFDAEVNVKVYLESHQRPPVVIHNKNLVVEEGKPVKLESSKLKVTHEANSPSEITFAVKTPPTYGYLRRFIEDEERYVGTQEDPVRTFSQQDVNAGNVQYVQVVPGQVNDTLTLEATNGVADISDITVTVDIIPHYIPLKVSNITLKEGASKALTEEILSVTSRHFSGLNFLYSVSEGPSHGRIENSRFRGTPINTFTRRQVEQEFIYYVHDNSETTEDNFTIIANDTDLRKHSLPVTVQVHVLPVNDEPPVVTANRVLRVWVGSVTEITPEDTRAEDEDSLPEELEFITTQPSNGHLALKSAPTRPIMNFTQALIDQGQLLFVHRGAMAGGFNFQVNDGVNFAPRQIFSIMARALVLRVEKNSALKVFPGSLSSITKEDLQVVTNDDEDKSNRTIVFAVLNPPKFGKLVNTQANNSAVEISSFTQEMVNEGVVAYHQTETDAMGWAALDTVRFTVSSSPATLDDLTFNINISYENTGRERNTLLLKNTGAAVTEGDKVHIDKSKLDASNLMTKRPQSQRHSYEVWYQVTTLPEHGVIVVGERNLTVEKPYFSQYILNKYGITYQHDNSETTQDRFVFDAFLNLKSKPAKRPLEDGDVVRESFNITVTPVNDQPPVLKTKSPSLRVVQGDTVPLGPSNLNVVDLDNTPEEIHYTVISKPSNGFLALEGTLNESVVTFSQAQINDGKVFFVQDGSPSSGVFYFSVTDGHHKPVYKLFNLEVAAITISLSSNTEVLLEQGQTSVVLNQSHLAAETNGRNTSIHYRVTLPPRHGKLLMDSEEVFIFTHEDLERERISYHMVDLMSSSDSFEFTASTSEANLTGQVVNITVKPLIRYLQGMKIPNGIRVKLRPQFLNATELAVLSSSDPVFEILSPPRYGRVVRASKDKKAIPVESFSFSEVHQETLALEVNANLTGVQELNDSFAFTLKADNVQPANGELFFSIIPYDPALATTTVSSVYTSGPASRYQTTVMNSALFTASPSVQSTLRSAKTVPKTKRRNRWGDVNRSDSPVPTIPKSTLGKEEIIPMKNTPVRVESVAQESSNPLLVILPLLAFVLLVVILVVLVLFLRRQRHKKPRPKSAPARPVSQDGLTYQGPVEQTQSVPKVTVTPLSPSCPGSPALDRLQGLTGNSDSPLPLYSWGDLEREASQLCRSTNPTLQSNQYWV
ncbi:chondroitin sulfate proteoglycan 4 [Chanos chanos]|uniref:Chondroitin sulfate proteoglycan 4 n=1 Tax=Chanos chanos TaxID=29144 RepID=A0A6J2WMZ5_CHACN|nr:chondroitin sulfate proteoglycan 4-like [Chanos chanos]